MRYMLLLHYPEGDEQSLGAEALEAGRVAFATYAATLEAAGVLIAAEVLRQSESTTTLTLVDGEPRIQDGPFTDTKEQLGGVFVIDVADLDAAIDWAQRAPAAQWGPVEIRPVATYTVGGIWVA
ncbi:YciI family protein [Agromyces sp. NPDC055520]